MAITAKIGTIVPSVRDAYRYVVRKEEFCTKLRQMMEGPKARHMAGVWITTQNSNTLQVDRVTYTVFSYGTHFPMFVYDPAVERWYGNRDKYSRTTSKHQRFVQPPHVEAWFDTETLQIISKRGITGYVTHKIGA